jgi:hypothetical protein
MGAPVLRSMFIFEATLAVEGGVAAHGASAGCVGVCVGAAVGSAVGHAVSHLGPW